MTKTIAYLSFVAMLAIAYSNAFAALGDCGQPQTTGDGPKTTDALAILKRSVASPSACDEDPCICDVNGNGLVVASDALLVLKVAVGQNVTLDCDCPGLCLNLAGFATLAQTPSAQGTVATPPLIRLEMRIITVQKTYLEEIGIDWSSMATVETDAGPRAGGTNGLAADLSVGSNATGGPSNDYPYLLQADHRPEGALPVLNLNFVSPFEGHVKTFFPLPGNDCVLFEEGTATAVDFPGSPVVNLEPFDAGFDGDVVHYSVLDDTAKEELFSLLKTDPDTGFLFPEVVIPYAGQSILHMVDDIEPALNDVTADFRMNIKDVTENPINMFTGPTVDVTPRIGANGAVNLDVRLASEMLSFFFSTSFMVGGNVADAEIPIHRRSRNVIHVTVPAGETLVMGGLSNGETVQGLPLLGRVPLIGSQFTHKVVNPAEQNLILFIKPAILD